MILSLKLKPKTLAPLPSLRRFSSSSSSPRPPPPPADSEGGGGGENEDSPPRPCRLYSSLFSDIKERFKSPPTPPRRIPTDPPPPHPLSSLKRAPRASFEEIRNNLAGLRMRSGGGPPPPSGERPPSSPPTISFQELLKINVLNKTGDGGAGEGGAAGKGAVSFDSIRESFRQFRPSPRDQTGPRRFDLRVFQDSSRRPAGEAEKGPSLIGGRETLPESIFGKELREKKGEDEGESKALRTEFVKMYSYNELEEKFRKLRPEEAMKGDKEAMKALNERPAKLRELEKETESRMGGVSFKRLRESVVRIKEAVASKKSQHAKVLNVDKSWRPGDPSFFVKTSTGAPIGEVFPPGSHVVSREVEVGAQESRDEFKMSESDCGSARVQDMSGRKRRERPRTMDEFLGQSQAPTPTRDPSRWMPTDHDPQTPLVGLPVSTPAPTRFRSPQSMPVGPSPSTVGASTSTHTASTTTSSSSSRGRGPARGIPSWNAGTLYDVQFDDTFHPVGKGARPFISQLGHMVRDPHRFPLTMLDWIAFPQDTIDRLWGEVKDNLRSCPDDFRPVCLAKCRKLWKDHKNKVKKEHWEKNLDDPDLLQRVPRGVLPAQWPELVRYWSSEKAREEAERNSQNRSMQGPTHKLGTRHVTQIRHELRERGEPTDRMSVWMASRRLDHPEVAALVAQFEARLAELPEEERQVVARRDEIFHTIIGQDGHGYTLTYGTGIPRSSIMRAESSGCSSSQGPHMRTNEEVAEMIQSLHQQMDARVEDLRMRMEAAMQAEVQAQVQEQVRAFKAELQQRLAQTGVPIADDSDPPIHTQAPDACSGHQARHESVGEGMPDPVGSNEQNRVD